MFYEELICLTCLEFSYILFDEAKGCHMETGALTCWGYVFYYIYSLHNYSLCGGVNARAEDIPGKGKGDGGCGGPSG